MLSRYLCRSVLQPVSRRLLSFTAASQTTQSEPQPDPWASSEVSSENVSNSVPQQSQPTMPSGLARAAARENAPVLACQVTGTVKWFDSTKGFGFIIRSDTQQDCFVHFTGIAAKNPAHIMRSLGDGESVVFDVVQGERGLDAVRVTGPGGAPVRGSERPSSGGRPGGRGQGAVGGGGFGGAPGGYPPSGFGAQGRFGAAPPAHRYGPSSNYGFPLAYSGYGNPAPNYVAPSASGYGGPSPSTGGGGYGDFGDYGGQQGGYGGPR